MTTPVSGKSSRALVLGGGGVTGIAWEVGILAALLEAGIDLGGADPVIGTSAGAFVGVALASGYDMQRLFEAQLEPSEHEVPMTVSAELYAEWTKAFETGGSDPGAIGAAFGAIARARPEPVPLRERRAVVEARLVTHEWPAALRITAIDADTGQLHVFDSRSEVALVEAVSASGAVPGLWPLERIDGKSWIDGGMGSAANASLADGYDRVVVIAPLPGGYGSIPGAVDDVASMQAQALLIAPDEASVEAIGPNPYDPGRRRPAAAAGRIQGTGLADAVAAIW